MTHSKKNLNKKTNWILDKFKYAENKDGDCWGHRWRGLQQLRYKQILFFLADHIPNDRHFHVLDIGCALGDFTEKFINQYPNATVTSIDISDKAITIASKRLPLATFKQTTLPNLSFENSEFDMIMAHSVLYYLSESDREQVFRNINRVLKHNGIFILSNPIDNGEEYFSLNWLDQTFKTNNFQVLDQQFQYSSLAVKFESKFLIFVNIFKKIQSNTSFSIKPTDSTLKKYIKKNLNTPFLKFIILFFGYPIYRIVRFIISIQYIPNLLQKLSKVLNKKTTHAMFICQKKFIPLKPT